MVRDVSLIRYKVKPVYIYMHTVHVWTVYDRSSWLIVLFLRM